MSVLSLDKVSVISSLGQLEAGQEDTINTFILDDHNINVITHHKSGLFKMWEWRSNNLFSILCFLKSLLFLTNCYFNFIYTIITANKLVKLWKSIHKGPVVQMAITNVYVTMASGGTDGTVRLWDLLNHACTHNLKGVQGVIRYMYIVKYQIL